MFIFGINNFHSKCIWYEKPAPDNGICSFSASVALRTALYKSEYYYYYYLFLEIILIIII